MVGRTVGRSVGQPTHGHTVKYLGKFHGNCYAMKEWDNDGFQDIVRQLSKTRFEQVASGQPSYDAYVRETPKRGISAVRNRYATDGHSSSRGTRSGM